MDETHHTVAVSEANPADCTSGHDCDHHGTVEVVVIWALNANAEQDVNDAQQTADQAQKDADAITDQCKAAFGGT